MSHDPASRVVKIEIDGRVLEARTGEFLLAVARRAGACQGGTFPSPLDGQSPSSLPPPRAPRAEPLDVSCVRPLE